MKRDFIHKFKGYGRVPSKCRVHLDFTAGVMYICFEDMNDGTSVTNASEQLASEIVNDNNLDPDNCSFFESYDDFGTFDIIEYDWKEKNGEWIASNPVWRPGNGFALKLFKE